MFLVLTVFKVIVNSAITDHTAAVTIHIIHRIVIEEHYLSQSLYKCRAERLKKQNTHTAELIERLESELRHIGQTCTIKEQKFWTKCKIEIQRQNAHTVGID